MIIKNLEGQRGLMFGSSTWTPPDILPHISNETIAVDTEVKDNGLIRERGPGWFNDDGYLLGVSVAWSGGSLYAPVRHPETDNLPLAKVIAWLETLFRNNHVCFFNCSFDMGWLYASGCRVWPRSIDDGSVASVLLDENWDTYSLEDCCARAGLPGKDEVLLHEAAASYGVIKKNGTIKHGMWRIPARYVGPYAEQDAQATLGLCQSLTPLLKEEGLMDAYRTELELIPVVNDMRRRGIRIDINRAEQVRDDIRVKAKEALALIDTPWQRRCTIDDIYSAKRLSEIFDAENVEYPQTPTGLPSFQKLWLEHLTHPLGAKIRAARSLHDLAEKFIANYVLDYMHMGRIHAEIHPLRSDRGGAKTLRFAYSNPPLQQIPSRGGLAPLIRSIFLPEEECQWLAADFKSQEPRLTAHYAHLSAKVAKQYGITMGDTQTIIDYYHYDPKPDPHALTAKLMGKDRYTAKQLNLALTYRMGPDKLSTQLNMPLDEAEELWNTYHASQPYIQGLAKFCEMRAQTQGYIRMIDGARRHFPLWQPKKNRLKGFYAREEKALERWPDVPLERAFAYQAGNSLIQGSASRQVKKAIVNCYKAGFLPLLTMHDEIDHNVTSAKECREIGQIMVESVKLIVPVDTDLEVGVNWGASKDTDYRKVFT